MNMVETHHLGRRRTTEETQFIFRCLEGNRSEDSTINHEIVLENVEYIKKYNTKDKENTENIKSIFFRQSFQHINAIAQEYIKQTGESLEHFLRIRFIFDDLYMFMTNVIKYSKSPKIYIIDCFRKYSKNEFLCDLRNRKILMHLILYSCENNLEIIKEEFYQMYQITLSDYINKITASESYKKALFKLIGEMPSNYGVICVI